MIMLSLSFADTPRRPRGRAGVLEDGRVGLGAPGLLGDDEALDVALDG